MMAEQVNPEVSAAVDGEVLTLAKSGVLLQLLRDLIACESETGNEAAIVGVIAGFLDSNGLPCESRAILPNRPNVFSWYGPRTHRTLLLTGHVDTVPIGDGWTRDPFGRDIANGRIFGRGAADMKGGLAAMLIVMVALNRIKPESDATILFAGCIDEEESGLGTRAAVAAGLQATWAVIGEPTELQAICCAKGNHCARISIVGRAAHASVPFQGINAIYRAADVVRAVRSYADTLSGRRHALLGERTVSVGTIMGGNAPSVIPDRCTIEIDFRLLPGDEILDVLRQLEQAIVEAVPPETARACTFSLVMSLPAFELALEHRLITELCAAARAVGLPLESAKGWPASCDAGILADANTPTALFGPGSIVADAHRPDESVCIDDVTAAARVYGNLAARFLDNKNGGRSL